MALGGNPKVTRQRFTKAFDAGIIHWQSKQTPMGEQWRLQWQRKKHSAFLKRRRVHPAYRRVFVYCGTFAASNYGRVMRDCDGDLVRFRARRYAK